MILRILAGSIVALGLGLFAEKASADQTFMCEDGRLLQVKLDDLERLKREDPCIAAHYGMTVLAMPLPAQPAPLLKGPQAAAKPLREIGSVAQASGSYRNVRIINAQPGANPWYSHTR